MNAPLVSVIVPVYNREKYLQKCIESITGQTLRNIEIICVDDGSTDSSLSKLEALQAADERIKIISRENRGVSVSRNEGIEVARGHYVAFMDSDDFYPDRDILETLYTKAKTHGVKICGGEMLFYDENKGGLWQDNSSETEGYRFSCEGVIQYRDYQFDWGFSRFIYDRSMLIENNLIFPPFKRGEDAVFFVKAHIISKEFYACRKAVYAYRINHKTSEWTEDVVCDIVKGLRALWDIAVQHDLQKLQKYCCRPILFKKQMITQDELIFLDSMEYAARIKPKNLFSWIYSKYRSHMVEGRRHLCILGRKFSYYKTEQRGLLSKYKRLRRWLSVYRVRHKSKIHVLFIAYSQAMWKVDALYRTLTENKRFCVDVLVVPNMGESDIEARTGDYEKLKAFFDSKGYHYEEWTDIQGNSIYQHIPDKYDVLFYPQPYPEIVPHALDFPKHRKRLCVNCEYAFHSSNQNWAYNKPYQNLVWFDCYENEVTYRISCVEKSNRGINSVVTGLPIVDELSREDYISPWKEQSVPCKKIIWAPHWTINAETSILPCYSNFLEMADYMLSFAHSQKGKMQFAFKPHPRLRRELYLHSEWGKEKTDAYYAMWENGENTQLEQGEYVDLFMTSDAMIHDSSSFCCEYLFAKKPVFFMVKNEEAQVAELNEMSRAAFYSQYLGYSISDLVRFFEEQVVSGNDFKKEARAIVVSKYLLPPNQKTTAENIISYMLGYPV